MIFILSLHLIITTTHNQLRNRIPALKSLITIFILFCTLNSFAQPAGYIYGKHILINTSQVSGTANLNDFTVLISFTDNDLRTLGNGGHVQNSNGFDIVFTEGDCETMLDHQIEKYDPSTGEYIAWVRIPTLFATVDYGIQMYYSNPTISTDPSTVNAWEPNYEGIWHMNNDPSSSQLTDYSGNSVDGTSYGSMTTTDLVSGQIGDAIDLDGSNDYFALATKSYSTTNSISQISISAWINTTFASNGQFHNWSIIDFDRSEFFNVFVHGDGRLGFSTDASGIHDAYAGSVGDLNDGNWHHITCVYDGTDKLYYIDGALSLISSNPHSGTGLGSNTTRFGFIGDGSEANSFNGNRNNIYYDGMYDEIRFTTNVLSSNWIQTEFNNQNSPSTFYTVSAEYIAVDLCVALPIELVHFTAESTGNTVILDWQTSSEKNNDFFTIERSTNGSDWEVLKTTKGAGNSQSLLKYFEIDAYPFYGVSYYRLKQTDIDGQFEYSQIQSVHIKRLENSSIEFYPNPVNKQITIVGNDDELNNITIYNSLGQDLTALTKQVSSSDHKRVIDFFSLKTGFYIIKTKTSTFKVYKL